MKKFMDEFKTFALRGNVMDMAVGVIIGAAFGAIVTSLVEDIINPLIGLFANKDLSGLVIKIGEVELRYGSFISAIINFLIIALVLFCLIKMMNKASDLGKKDEPAADPTEKECPYCMSQIPIKATRCPHCTSKLDI